MTSADLSVVAVSGISLFTALAVLGVHLWKRRRRVPAAFVGTPAPSPRAKPAALPAEPASSVRPLLLTATAWPPAEPALPEWAVARCTVQSSFFHGFAGRDSCRLIVRGAALRGHDHAVAGMQGQDVAGVVWDERGGALYAVVADGLGSLPDSGRVAADVVRQALDRCRARPPGKEFSAFARGLFTDISRTIETADPPVSGATTLVLAEVVPDHGGATISVCATGDSEAWMLHKGQWRALLHERDPGAENATRHLPGHPEPMARAAEAWPGDVLVLGTDGFAGALATESALGEELARRWRKVPSPLEFLVHVDFHDGYRADDRAAVSIWIR